MIFKWIEYLLLLAFAAYEAIIFEEPIVSTLFAAVVMWPLLSMGILFYQRRCLDIVMKIPVPVAEQDGRIQIQFDVRYMGIGTVTNMDAKMICISHFTGEQKKEELSFYADSRQCRSYHYELSGQWCGKVRIDVAEVCIWDYFHFFCLKKRVRLSEEVTFLPEIYETAVTVCEATRHFAGETEDYEPEAAGSDHSQIYQIRAYRPGDRLQMIHWKLTARNDELFVKEASEPQSFAVGIFVDLSGSAKEGRRRLPLMVKAVLSISNGLLEQKCRHFIVWYDFQKDKMIKRKISRIEDIYETAEYMMSMRVCDHTADIMAMYREAYPYGLYAVALHVDLEGNILKEDTLVGRYLPKDDVIQDMKETMSELLIQV